MTFWKWSKHLLADDLDSQPHISKKKEITLSYKASADLANTGDVYYKKPICCQINGNCTNVVKEEDVLCYFFP